jgi:methylenetetrahydrofolate reductase (NADPH)
MKMHKPSSITSALNQDSPLFSVEFFPPKDDAGGRRMLETAEAIRPYSPNFVSITYGAGGGTRETTMRYARILQDEYNFEVMPHLTCVGHTVNELLEILEDFAKAGFRNVMALRGDPPQGEDVFKATAGGLSYGSDLVELIRKHFPDFGIGVGGYPEKHPEAEDKTIDLANLKTKVDAGADFITTQLFFDNRVYFDFVKSCNEAGIDKPILPGLLPVLSLGQVRRFCKMCEASLPDALEQSLTQAEDEDHPVIGSEWAAAQISELLNGGAPGYHIYALNKPQSTLQILESLGIEKTAA